LAQESAFWDFHEHSTPVENNPKTPVLLPGIGMSIINVSSLSKQPNVLNPLTAYQIAQILKERNDLSLTNKLGTNSIYVVFSPNFSYGNSQPKQKHNF
jgi:hypothetical protein